MVLQTLKKLSPLQTDIRSTEHENWILTLNGSYNALKHCQFFVLTQSADILSAYNIKIKTHMNGENSYIINIIKQASPRFELN